MFSAIIWRISGQQSTRSKDKVSLGDGEVIRDLFLFFQIANMHFTLKQISGSVGNYIKIAHIIPTDDLCISCHN